MPEHPEETAAHVEKETLTVDVDIPEHDPRVTTDLFRRSRKELLERVGGRCWVCNRTEQEAGAPLEAHHYPIERCLAGMIDWELFKKDALSGYWGERVQAFDWANFDPTHWVSFVDDMNVNGMALCAACHRGKDEGIHYLPYPLWIAQKYGKEGYRFSDIEIIHHAQ